MGDSNAPAADIHTGNSDVMSTAASSTPETSPAVGSLAVLKVGGSNALRIEKVDAESAEMSLVGANAAGTNPDAATPAVTADVQSHQTGDRPKTQRLSVTTQLKETLKLNWMSCVEKRVWTTT